MDIIRYRYAQNNPETHAIVAFFRVSEILVATILYMSDACYIKNQKLDILPIIPIKGGTGYEDNKRRTSSKGDKE